ncbi:MAG: PHP domain-containing protein [Myxococcales bacterium]|nr:PHP domain-containing protein [Myxococcales bacterium]
MARRIGWIAALCVALWACDDDGGSAAPAQDGALTDGAASDAGPGDARVDAAPPVDVGPQPDDAATDAAPPTDAGPPDLGPPPDGPRLLGVVCPGAGRATAAVLETDERLDGPDAIGSAGDLLLMNDRAAFVITGPGPQKTYYYYPGVLADAVPLEDCAQTAPDRFDEVGFLVGRPDLADFPQSVLRAFHGTRAEVVDDGRGGGEARIRLHGVDDIQWLVELELLKRAVLSGGRKDLSEAMGLELYLDLVLPPDSHVLRVELHVRNLLGEPQRVLAGAMAIFGDTAPATYFHDAGLSFGGLSLRLGLPWITSRSGDGAWALAMADANVATTNIAGVDAFLDGDALLRPPTLAAAGEDGDRRVFTFFLAVGDRDVNSAVRHLQAANPRGLRRSPYMLGPFGGRVVDAETGAAVGGAEVIVAMRNQSNAWEPLDAVTTDDDGTFAGMIPAVGAPLRAEVRVAGRAAPEPVPIDLATADVLDLTVPPAGALRFTVRDDAGAAIPARVQLFDDAGREAYRLYAVPSPRTRPVVPGAYTAVVSRGYEWSVVEQPIEVPPNGEGDLEVTLTRVLDTTGWLSTDGHMHAGPSADSTVLIAERLETAAAAGLDVAISTDHEIVRDWKVGLPEAGLEGVLAVATGQEVTASLPEHVNAYPFEPLPADQDFRGGPVVWYGLDLGQVFAAIRERGAGVVQLNHPRNGCNYLCLIGYDRLTGRPAVDDPTLLGFPPEAELWSWDFDAVEYMNGTRSPFVDPAAPDSTGMFEDWTSFLNLGHRVTAMGVTDVHGHGVGTPRTFFAAPTDDPGAFTDAMLTDAIRGGAAQVSAGAFARVTVDGAGPGEDVTLVDGAGTLRLRVDALPQIDVTHAIVYVNCDEAMKIAATAPGDVVKLDVERALALDADAYVVVTAHGAQPMPRAFDDYDGLRTPRVTTNAIYVDADGDGVFTPPGGKTCTYDLSAP